MNKIHRNVWCESTGTWVAASELTRGKSKSSRSSGVRSAAAIAALGALLAGAAHAVPMQAIGDPATSAGYQYTVGNGNTLTIDGPIAPVNPGSYATGTPETVGSLVEQDRLTFTGGSANATNYTRYYSVSGNGVFAPEQNGSTTVYDPVTQSNLSFSTYQSSAITSGTYFPAFSDVGQLILDDAEVHIHQNVGLGKVESSGGQLNVDLGDAAQNIRADDNTIRLMAKNSVLTVADGTAGNSSNVDWRSRNRIDFQVVPVVAADTESMAQVVTTFGGNFSTTDGLGNSVAHSVSTPADLASYNDWLSGQIGNWLVPVANGGEGLTQAQAQQRYDDWMGMALTKETVTWNYKVWSDGGVHNNAATAPIGNLNVIHATGANAKGELAAGAALAVTGSNNGVMRADQGAKLVNNGELNAWKDNRFAPAAVGMHATDASATNNGVLNANLFIDNDGRQNVDSHGAYGIKAMGASTVSNTGVVNIGLSTLGQVARGVSLDGSSTGTNTGTINLTDGRSGSSAIGGATGYAVEVLGDASFSNASNGTIYLGRDAQASAGAAAADVAMSGGAALSAGIFAASSGNVVNDGTITIGSLTQNAAGIAAVGSTGLVTNNGAINVLGGNGVGAPRANIGLLAQNTGAGAGSAVTNNGDITVGGVNNIGIKVLSTGATDAAASTTSAGAINVIGGSDPSTGTRSYGVWVEGTGTGVSTANIDSPITLGGQGAIGVQVRSNGSTVVANVTQNATPAFGNTDQIAYFLFGNGVQANVASATMDDAGFARTTLFRVADGAAFNGTNGSGGQNLDLTVTGTDSVAVYGTGAGTTVTTADSTIHVGAAGNTGTTAVKIEGGATGNIGDNTTIVLNAPNTIAAVVDGQKHTLSGAATGDPVVTTLNSGTDIVSSLDGVTGYVARNLGAVTLDATGHVALDGNDSVGVDVQQGGRLTNNSVIDVGGGVGVRASGSDAQVLRLGEVNVDGGLAGVQLLDGAALTLNGAAGDTITTQGTANGVLLDTGAKSLDATGITITANGGGAGIENKAEIGAVKLTGVTINAVDGAAIRTATSFDPTSTATLNVAGTGTGIGFRKVDGSNATGDLNVGPGYDINVLASSNGGTGIDARTSGNVSTAGSIDVQGANGGAAVVAHDAASITNTGSLTSVSTVAPVIDGTGAGKTITNSGTVQARDNAAVAIQASANADTVNLAGGAVTGVVNTGEGSDKFNWTAGTLDGEVNMGNGAGNAALVGAVDLSKTRHILTGSGAGDTIEFSGTIGAAAKVGSFGATAAADDLARGTNIGTGWNKLAATNGADLRIVDTLQLAGAGSEIKTASGATLRVGGNGATTGSIANHDVVTSDANGAGTLVFDNLDSQAYSGVISGSGNFVRDVTGTTFFTADNTYTGTTTINNGGTLQLGADVAGGAATGGIAAVSPIVDNGALVINRSNDVLLGGAISGTGTLTQQGNGVTTLTGTNAYLGTTTVSAGTLLVNGNQSAATGATTVLSAATLGGSGTIGGDVTVNDGGILSPGSAGPGTLAINGALNLAPTAVQNWQFGQAYVPGGTYNDLVSVGKDLVLDGTLNVSVPTAPAGGSFGPGVYRVYNYGGALTNNGLELGAMPEGASDLYVQTSVANQVNLVNTTGVLLNYWDGTGGAGGAERNNSVINGGDGVWELKANDNWTNVTGQMNAPWSNNAFSVFQGAPAGTVTVSNASGQVMFSGAQFAVDGYKITGDTLVTDTAQTIIRVGDGTAAGAAYTATYDNVIAGTGGIDKTDAGTLVLDGANTYAGGTTVSGGTLRVSQDANLGAAGTGVTLNGGTLQYGAGFDTARQVTVGANNGTIDTHGNLATLTTDVTGPGKLTKAGAGTLTLTADNSYAGGTAITGGTLQLGTGGTTGSIVGDIANDGVLVANRSNTLALAGAISGSGQLQQIGSGTTVLSGANSYRGLTNVANGTLKAGAANTFSAASAHTVASGAALDTAGLNQVVGGLANAGTVSLLSAKPGSTLTVHGAYTGQDGVLKLGTQVGTGGISDRLVIDGGTARGRTTIAITDIGGLGGATTGSGIELVTAQNGATTTAQGSKNAFALAGDKILAGAFDYRLAAGDLAGAGENWYLRSNFRSEVPLYTAVPNLVRQGDIAMLGNLHRRVGDDDLELQAGQRTPSGWGGQGRRAWGRIIGGNSDLQQSSTAVTTDAHLTMSGFQTGVDLYADDNWAAGLYTGMLHNSARVAGKTDSGTLASGTAKIDSYYLGGYTTYSNADKFYTDLVLQYGLHGISTYAADPAASAVTPGSSDGSSVTASIEVGQPFALGASDWTVEPQAQLIYQRSQFSSTRITGSQVTQDPGHAVIGRLGVRLKGDFVTSIGRLQPYGRVNLWHGFSGHDTTSFVGPAATTAISTGIGYTSVEAAAGFTLKLSPTTSVYGEIGRTFKTGRSDNKLKSSVEGSVGVKWNF